MAGITMAGLTTLAGYSRLCLAYPKAHEFGGRMFTDARGIQQAAYPNTPLLREVLDSVGMAMTP